MDNTLEEQAIELSKCKTKLKKRLLEARSLLMASFRIPFKEYTYEFDKKRLVSSDGKYALCWQTRLRKVQ